MIVAILFIFASCESKKSTDSSLESESFNSTEVPNDDTSFQEMENKKYYQELSSSYNSEDNIADQIFIDGGFERNSKSQYKIISSNDELQSFTLLNEYKIDNSMFEDNCIVAILHYYVDSSKSAKLITGFYNISFDSNFEIKADKCYKYDTDSTDDSVDTYKLYFLVVPKEEIDENQKQGNISVIENVLEQYNISVIATENSYKTTNAYFMSDSENPFIKICLNEPIETDYIVNGFKYKNGELYITIQIFEKTEMIYLHKISGNQINVSLLPNRDDYQINLPDETPLNCEVNIIIERIVTKN
jgi:hypothetical protein